jgi:predicted SAM-dependent methyltransferase
MFRKLLLFLFSHRTLALLRWDVYFLRMRLLNVASRRNSKLLMHIGSMPRPRYLNLGSGPRGLHDPNWLNIDGFKDVNVHFTMDFNSRFPFENDTFDGIFCEHVFEHFGLPEGQALLQECLRVLVPGGCIRLIMPDGEKILRNYCNEPETLIKKREVPSGSAMESVNSWFYQRYEHQCIYDGKLLEWQLKNAGFEQISRSAFRQGGASKALLLDDLKYEWESIYMEAVKPGSVSSGMPQ